MYRKLMMLGATTDVRLHGARGGHSFHGRRK